MTFLLMFLLACPSKQAECSQDDPCGFGAECIEGVCEAQSCATSDQCGIEQFCKDSTCVDGCEADTDCRFGNTCDQQLHTCAPAACGDTHLDCGYKQFCSPTGECYDATGYFCAPCGDDAACGGNGNLCLNGGYCGVTCDTDADCPGSFFCTPIQDFNGNIISHQCYTSCWLFEE